MIKNIIQRAKENSYFREVLETGQHTQIVVMSIDVGGEIGEEVHADNDQILFLTEGKGEAVIEDKSEPFGQGDVVLIRAGTKHNFINKGQAPMKIITTYSPPHHPEGTIHKTKEEAMNAGY